MSMEQQLETVAQGYCPICSILVAPRGTVIENEILSCPECRSLLVVEARQGSRMVLAEAPTIEEDWGE
ncbi:MAG: lysine biosynthesis protein LysW [Candidatus Aminicenantales bacterium]|jgi:hypothetical protein